MFRVQSLICEESSLPPHFKYYKYEGLEGGWVKGRVVLSWWLGDLPHPPQLMFALLSALDPEVGS